MSAIIDALTKLAGLKKVENISALKSGDTVLLQYKNDPGRYRIAQVVNCHSTTLTAFILMDTDASFKNIGRTAITPYVAFAAAWYLDCPDLVAEVEQSLNYVPLPILETLTNIGVFKRVPELKLLKNGEVVIVKYRPPYDEQAGYYVVQVSWIREGYDGCEDGELVGRIVDSWDKGVTVLGNDFNVPLALISRAWYVKRKTEETAQSNSEEVIQRILQDNCFEETDINSFQLGEPLVIRTGSGILWIGVVSKRSDGNLRLEYGGASVRLTYDFGTKRSVTTKGYKFWRFKSEIQNPLGKAGFWKDGAFYPLKEAAPASLGPAVKHIAERLANQETAIFDSLVSEAAEMEARVKGLVAGVTVCGPHVVGVDPKNFKCTNCGCSIKSQAINTAGITVFGNVTTTCNEKGEPELSRSRDCIAREAALEAKRNAELLHPKPFISKEESEQFESIQKFGTRCPELLEAMQKVDWKRVNEQKSDLYCLAATAIFGYPVDRSMREERRFGKAVMLQLGYTRGETHPCLESLRNKVKEQFAKAPQLSVEDLPGMLFVDKSPIRCGSVTVVPNIGDPYTVACDSAPIIYGKNSEQLINQQRSNRCLKFKRYLDTLSWDGKARLDRMFTTYAGAEDNHQNRAAARATIRSAIHKTIEPGLLRDTIVFISGEPNAGAGQLVGFLRAKSHQIIRVFTTGALRCPKIGLGSMRDVDRVLHITITKLDYDALARDIDQIFAEALVKYLLDCHGAV